MWLEFISNLAQDSSFHSPAILNEITEIESTLEISLPKKLKELLEETNGIEGGYGLGLIWNTERIKRDNLNFRNSSDFKDLYMPFDHLLFFADAGNGDQFAFAIRNKEIAPLIFLFGIMKMIVGNGLHLRWKNIWSGG